MLLLPRWNGGISPRMPKVADIELESFPYIPYTVHFSVGHAVPNEWQPYV